MSGNALSVESSLGHLEVQFGWSDWVSITTPRSSAGSFAARRLVPTQEDLGDLLASFGLPRLEADTLARELWRHRPNSDGTEEFELGADVVAAPGRQLLVVAGAVALVLALVLVVAAAGLG
jgi:hypothetical protein